MLLSEIYKFAAWLCWSGRLIRKKNFPNILIQFLFCKIDLPNVVWKLQRTNDFSSKNAKSIIRNLCYLWWIRSSCCLKSWIWSSSSAPVNPGLIRKLQLLFFNVASAPFFSKSGKQMIAPVDCLLNAANWELLNKSEVEMLFLWVEKGEYLKKESKKRG